MSFDPLLTLLGLTALASPTVPTTYAPTATRAALRIAAAALPSTPGIGDLAIDSGDGNKLKSWNGTTWLSAGGGGTPAGADTQVQFNDGGTAFGGAATLAFNKTVGSLGIGIAPSTTARLSLVGPTPGAAIAPLRIGQSATIPGAFTDGDIWLTGANLFLRRNGGTSLLVEHAETTVTGQIPAWSSFNGVLGAATGLTWTVGGGGQQLIWDAGTRTSGNATGFACTYAMGAALPTGVTSAVRSTSNAGGAGNANAAAISTAMYALTNANINSIVDSVGARHVGSYSMVSSTPPSFGWAINSTFVGSLSRIVFTSATNDTNRPFYQMIGNDVELNMTLSGTSGTTGVIDSIIGLRVNPQTFSVGGSRVSSATNYYGLYLGTLTPTGNFSVTNRYGVYQADTAATNHFLGKISVERLNTTTAENQVYVNHSLAATGAASAYHYVVHVNSAYAPTGTVATAAVHLVRAIFGLSGSATGTFDEAIGFYGIVSNGRTTGPTNTLMGGYFRTNSISSTTTTGVYGAQAYLSLSGTVTSAHGFSVYGTGGGAVTNFYGIHIDSASVSNATNKYGIYQADSAAKNYFAGDVRIETAGKGLFIKEGSNAKMGTATLSNGGATVNTTAVSANSRIFLCTQSPSGTSGALRVNSRVAGTSFTVESTSNTDNSTFAWFIVDPA